MKTIKQLIAWVTCGSAAAIIAEEVGKLWVPRGHGLWVPAFVITYIWILNDLSQGKTLGDWCRRK